MPSKNRADSQQEPLSLSDAFRTLGFPNESVPMAITAFKSAANARRWIEILGDRAFSNVYLNLIRTPEVSPDDFVELNEAGLTETEALRVARSLSKDDIAVHHYLAWRSHGLEEQLTKFTPHFTEGLGAVEVLDTVRTRCATTAEVREAANALLRVLASGLPAEQIRAHLEAGYDSHDLYRWVLSGIPWPEWSHWREAGFAASDAQVFHGADLAVGEATKWTQAGFSSADTRAFTRLGIAPHEAQDWVKHGISGVAASAFILLGLTAADARAWTDAGIPVEDATMFIDNEVQLVDAKQWNACGFDAVSALDFMEKGATPTQAKKFREAGIDLDQLTRTETGVEVLLHPWQEDPLSQVPQTIDPGYIGFTLWSDALGGDMTAYDVNFTWDGKHTAEWYEDISSANDLSFASSSPARGALAWPSGSDVLLVYTWSELGMQGHHRFEGLAPSGQLVASDPRYWLRLAEAILDFVLLDIGGGGGSRERYFDVDDEEIDIEELFQRFLAGEGDSRPDFDSWLDSQVEAGDYTRHGDE